MSKEYIERETAIAFVKNNTPTLDKMTTIGCVERALYNAPAADVVEVVRCSDCKYYQISKSYTPYCSNVMNLFEDTKPTDYCSYGERKAGADNAAD